MPLRDLLNCDSVKKSSIYRRGLFAMNISLMVLKKLLRNASKISDDQAQMAFYTMFDYCIKGQVSEPYGCSTIKERME